MDRYSSAKTTDEIVAEILLMLALLVIGTWLAALIGYAMLAGSTIAFLIVLCAVWPFVRACRVMADAMHFCTLPSVLSSSAGGRRADGSVGGSSMCAAAGGASVQAVTG